MQKRFIKNEDAVSPVIGVILMVAITVILAAIIAGVVLPLASKTSVAPVASLVVTNSTNSDNKLGIEHKGGDALDLKDIRMTGSYADNGSSPFSIASMASAATAVNPGDIVIVDLDLPSTTTTVSTNIVITTGALTGSLNFAAGERIKLALFHVPSGKAIAEITFTSA